MDSSDIVQLIHSGEYNLALQFIESRPWSVEYSLLKVEIYLLTGKYDESLTIAEDLINKVDGLDEIKGMISKGYALWRLGRLDDALTLVEQISHTIVQFNRDEKDLPILERNLSYLRGLVHWSHGDLGLAYEIQKETVKKSENLGIPYLIGEAYNSLGVISRYLGRLYEALKYNQQCLKINEILGNKQKIAWSKGNIGEIYRLQGDLDLAMEHYVESVDILERIGDRRNTAEGYHYISRIYHNWSENDEAIVYSQKCLNLAQAIGNDFDTVRYLYFLLTVYVDENMLVKSNDIFDQLTILKERNISDVIILYHKLSEAILLRKSKRMKNVVKAQEILEVILTYEVYHSEIILPSMLLLLEILIDEVRLYNLPEVLEDANNLIDDILEITANENLVHINIETILLKSRFLLVQGEYSRAQKLLIDTKSSAQELDLNVLTNKIDNEIILYENQLQRWKELSEETSSVKDMLDELQLINYIKYMKRLTSEK